MGLIERVAATPDGNDPANNAARTSNTDGADRKPDAPRGPAFTIDFDKLAAEGVFNPKNAPKSQLLELRALKRNLLKRTGLLHGAGRGRRGARRSGRQKNIVLITSTRPGEGKTFTAVNLALSFAFEDRQPVLLIDGDVLRPKVRSYFDLPRGPGLTDRLMDPKIPVASIAWRTDQAPLRILSEGRREGGASDLFASEAATSFFAGLSTASPDRLIIIDAPPMLATTEAFALAQNADEVAFVVEADATPEPAVAVALDELLEVNPNVSLVLNRCLVPGGGAHYGSYESYDRTAPLANQSAAQAAAEKE
ncbi:MAG: hypothetical protein AAF224_10120 [Pseudomonadota bacterium]